MPFEEYDSGDGANDFISDVDAGQKFTDPGDLGYDGVLDDAVDSEDGDYPDEIMPGGGESVSDGFEEFIRDYGLDIEPQEARQMAADLEAFAAGGNRYDYGSRGPDGAAQQGPAGYAREVPLEDIEAEGLDYAAIEVTTEEAMEGAPYSVGITASRYTVGVSDPEALPHTRGTQPQAVEALETHLAGVFFQPSADGGYTMHTVARSTIFVPENSEVVPRIPLLSTVAEQTVSQESEPEPDTDAEEVAEGVVPEPESGPVRPYAGATIEDITPLVTEEVEAILRAVRRAMAN